MLRASDISGAGQCRQQTGYWIFMFAVFKEEMGRGEEPRAEMSLENLRERDQIGVDGIIILK